jgi:polyferredoxin
VTVPIFLLVPTAAAMVVATAFLVRWAAEANTAVRAASVVFLLAMMTAMFVGAWLYFVAPSSGSLVLGLWIAALLMSLSVFPLVSAVLADVQRRLTESGDPGPAPVDRPRAFRAAVVLLVFASEWLMGATFQLAYAPPSTGSPGFASLGLPVFVSPWFLFPMAAEMALTAFLLRHRLGRGLGLLLAFQAVVMALAPPALHSTGWVDLSIYAGSVAMIGLFVYVMEYIYRHRQLAVAFSAYLVRLVAVYALMMTGLFVWLEYGTPLLFAVAVPLEMVLYFDAVTRPEAFEGSGATPWQLDPTWAFQLLAGIFVAELFMGAVLDLALEPAAYAALFPTAALTGAPGTVVYNAVYNGFWFTALVTGSTWFLAMMGVEMGALVVFKLRETKVPETRFRLYLMLGSYAAFATFFPSIYYTALLPNWPSGTAVPVLGWSMGIGSSPLAPSVFTIVLLTYAITGILSVLFGRRVICSIFCTAPLMYQGTTLDAMRSFNRSSRIGRKYLGSHFSNLYSVTTGVVMVSLVGASSLSYLDSIGRLQLTILGADPTVFLFALSFGVLWYVMFVTIPYVGDYNCVTMGWCYTGAIAQAFHRIGFFKLKVKDRNVCQACTTLDCAKSCPVGLVDMVGYFRSTGEFRSSKCCGVGNCVGACPYGNLYIHDIRHWLRSRDGPRPIEAIGPTIPMVGTASALRATPSAARTGALPTPAPRGDVSTPA